MKEQNLEDEVMKILDDIPNGRRALMENYDNLMNVAEYCNTNYTQSGDSSMIALNETKNLATQSLASVAYQINTLASSILHLLDAQTNQLHHMESSINLIGQKVEMHKEKVSRREIGVFTAAKQVPRSQKVLSLSSSSPTTQPHPPYSRRPINYQQLDSVGHGIKVSGKQSERTGTIRKHGASVRSTKAAEPVQCPVVPPISSSSFGRPVAPPTISTTTLAPPLTNEISAQNDDDATSTPPPPPPPPPPGSSEDLEAPPPPPGSSEDIEAPPPPLPPGSSQDIEAPPPPPLHPSLCLNPDRSYSPPAPPSYLETVVEENCFPSPSPPPPPPEEDAFPLATSEVLDLPTPPPPNQEGEDLEIPGPPLPVLLDDEGCVGDTFPPLPPPADYGTSLQSLEKVVALYDYEATRPDDLSMTEGDIICLIHRHGDGWCEGILRGNRGFFPENYVQSCG